MRTAHVCALVPLALVVACTQSGEPQEDRTLRKLKEAQAQSAPASPGDPNAELARTALSEPHSDALTWDPVNIRADDVLLDFRRATKTKVLKSPRVTLTTADEFVELELLVENVGTHDAALPLTTAVLKNAAQSWPLARDAQRVAGSHDLEVPLAARQSRTEKLLFEIPDAELKGPLILELPTTKGAATLELRAAR